MNHSIGKSLLLAVGLTLSAATNADLGSMLGNTCAGCHGLNGASAGDTMPIISGLSRDFIIMAMQEYRAGLRGSTIMGRIAKGYNDQQLAAIADFFAKQQRTPAPQKYDPAFVKHGAQLHLKRCEACHRDNGASMALDMQPLAGQWAGYLQLYMSSCADTKWKNRHPDAMSAICSDLSVDDVAALVQFYASQK